MWLSLWITIPIPNKKKIKHQNLIGKLDPLWLLLDKRFIIKWNLTQPWQILGKLRLERRVGGTKMVSLTSPPEALVQGRQVQVCRESKRPHWGSKGETFWWAYRSPGHCVVPPLWISSQTLVLNLGVRSSSQKGELDKEWRKEVIDRNPWALLKLFSSIYLTARPSESSNYCFTSAFQTLHKFLFCQHYSGDIREMGCWEM